MGNGQSITVLERIKYVAEDYMAYMAHFPPERRGAILLGALASVYGKEDGGMDTAVCLAESKDDQTHLLTSIAHQTIEALCQIGWLDDIIATKEGLVVYSSQPEVVNI